jgi:hypothetical protein
MTVGIVVGDIQRTRIILRDQNSFNLRNFFEANLLMCVNVLRQKVVSLNLNNHSQP